jgi:hypothetical protein
MGKHRGETSKCMPHQKITQNSASTVLDTGVTQIFTYIVQ